MYDLFQRLYYFFLERQQLICLQYFTSMIHLLNHEQSYYNTEHMQVFFTFGKIKFDINTRYFLSADFRCSLESSRSLSEQWPKVSQFCISQRSKINLKKKQHKHLYIRFQSDLLSADKTLQNTPNSFTYITKPYTYYEFRLIKNSEHRNSVYTLESFVPVCLTCLDNKECT